MERRIAVLAAAGAALVLPGAAWAHAHLVGSVPADRAVVSRAPHAVRFAFDDVVHVAGGNTAVANAGGAAVTGGAAVATGRILTIPLRPGLARGAYTVRWSVVSDDGHHEAGVIAFAIGRGGPAPVPILTARSPLRWNVIALRALWYAGILAAAGAAAFVALTRRVAPMRRQPVAHFLFFSFLAVLIGGDGILQEASGATRFATVVAAGTVLAVIGGVAAALVRLDARLLQVAEGAALLLLLVPILSGHALDAGQPAVLAPLLDLAHIGAAAVWSGGLLCLLVLVPRAVDPAARAAALGRFSRVALWSVLVLAAAGAGRALTELDAFSQLWSTSYGRVLVAKTALFAALLLLGGLTRVRLRHGAVSLAVPGLRAELLLAGGTVVAVTLLTLIAPAAGRRDATAAVPAPPALTPPAPPPAAVVDARELGRLAVAVARTPGTATVTILTGDGIGASGLRVAIGGRKASPCGAGCYGAPVGPGRLTVAVDGRHLRFDVLATAPDATRKLARITRWYRARRSLVFDETLASTPSNAQTTRFELVAPDGLRYTTRGGPAAVVIGRRRWDRAAPGAGWETSEQSPLEVMQPYWRHPTNAHLVARDTLTFFEPAIPAWFRVRLNPRTGLPVRTTMTAAAHFMVDRYRSYDTPVPLSPPP